MGKFYDSLTDTSRSTMVCVLANGLSLDVVSINWMCTHIIIIIGLLGPQGRHGDITRK